MNSQTQITPCQAMRRRDFRGQGALSRAVRIAFEPDAGKLVVVDVRRASRQTGCH